MGVFIVIDPREWTYFVVQFGNGKPVEVTEVPFCQEVGWQLKWLLGCEPIYPSFLEWRGSNWLVQLAVAVVSAVEWLNGVSSSGYGDRSEACFLLVRLVLWRNSRA